MNKFIFKIKLFNTDIFFKWTVIFVFAYALITTNKPIEFPIIAFFYIILILIHELGHAYFVKIRKAIVSWIEIDFIGGLCHYQGNQTQKDVSFIAWGGIFFQILLFIASFTILTKMDQLGISDNIFYEPILKVFIILNVILIIINLIPVRNLDGTEAWKLFKILINDRKKSDNKFNNNKINDNPILFKEKNKKYENAKKTVNELFEKITKHGVHSLSNDEKKKLERARKIIKIHKKN